MSHKPTDHKPAAHAPHAKHTQSEPRADAATAAQSLTVDEFTSDQIVEFETQAVSLIAQVEKTWAGLVQMVSKDRMGSSARGLQTVDPSLRALLTVLTPDPEDPDAMRATRLKLKGMFDQSIGDEDNGKNPDIFEIDLVLRRLQRMSVEAAIAAKLGKLQRKFLDDVLNTGELVAEPAKKALELATSFANMNAEFKSALAPVIEALADTTKAARAALAEAREQAKQAKALAAAQQAAAQATPQPAAATTPAKP